MAIDLTNKLTGKQIEAIMNNDASILPDIFGERTEEEREDIPILVGRCSEVRDYLQNASIGVYHFLIMFPMEIEENKHVPTQVLGALLGDAEYKTTKQMEKIVDILKSEIDNQIALNKLLFMSYRTISNITFRENPINNLMFRVRFHVIECMDDIEFIIQNENDKNNLIDQFCYLNDQIISLYAINKSVESVGYLHKIEEELGCH